jgi:hypothetical protein
LREVLSAGLGSPGFTAGKDACRHTVASGIPACPAKAIAVKLAQPNQRRPGNIFPWSVQSSKTKGFLEKPGADGMAYPMLGEIPDMITAIPFQFRSRLDLGGAILAQQATFLPVAPVWTVAIGNVYTPDTQLLAGFMPTFNFNRKNLTVARPLLKDPLQ